MSKYFQVSEKFKLACKLARKLILAKVKIVSLFFKRSTILFTITNSVLL